MLVLLNAPTVPREDLRAPVIKALGAKEVKGRVETGAAGLDGAASSTCVFYRIKRIESHVISHAWKHNKLSSPLPLPITTYFLPEQGIYSWIPWHLLRPIA